MGWYSPWYVTGTFQYDTTKVDNAIKYYVILMLQFCLLVKFNLHRLLFAITGMFNSTVRLTARYV